MIISVDRRWRLQVATSFERKTRHFPDDVVPRGKQGTRGREGGNGDGTSSGGRDVNEVEDENGHKDGDGSENGSGNEGDNREEGGGEREPGNLLSGNGGGSEDARGGATPMSNQQPHSQDPTPQRDRRIMRVGVCGDTA